MNVAIVGLGLIGGSFYKASQKAGHQVVGLHHGDQTGFESADLILVCLPPNAVAPWIRERASGFRSGAVVVDIAGVKQSVVSELGSVPKDGWYFVGGHPMAGREVSGFDNSLAELFVGASMILTPGPEIPESVIADLKDYFASVGFHETVVTSPERHDDMIAFTSQLCHIIATTYVRDPRVKDAIGFSAGSYANMTRIATQDAAIWSELYASNRDALVNVMDGFAARFKELRDAIAADDRSAVMRLIDEGTAAKCQELLERKRGDEEHV